MKITEKDIMHENGDYWVMSNRAKRSSYEVLKNTNSGYAITLIAFEFNADGLSLAIAYCDYLANGKVR